jgi:primosomal protein N' (replication factor Y)
VILQGHREAAVRKEADRVAARLRETGADLEVLGPAPCLISRIQGAYRWHVAVKAATSARIGIALAAIRSRIAQRGPVRVVADVDPAGLM